MPINDIYQAALRFSINGEKTANVLHFEQTSSDGSDPPNEDLANAIIEDIWPSYKAAISNDATLQSVAVKKISPAIGGSIIVSVNEPGSISSDTIPPNGAAVVTLYSQTLSKQGRGRIYISGIPDNGQANGILDVAQMALFVTLADKIIAPVQAGTGATFQCGVWSTVGSAFHDFTDHMVRSTIRTLRSRRMANP